MSIDFHTHILPGVDDGSRNVEISLAMLEEESRQDVDKIVLTPHFYAHRDSVEDFLQRREHSFKKLRDALAEKEKTPQLYVGAEVYYFQGIGDADMVPGLCVEGTNTLLLEMPFAQWNKEIVSDVEKLVKKQKLRVVIAHIERYYEFQKNKEFWEKVMALPLHKQMNGGTFLDWRRRRKAFHLIDEAGTVILGSDCHNMDGRHPNLAEGRTVIAKKMGESFLLQSDSLSEELLQ